MAVLGQRDSPTRIVTSPVLGDNDVGGYEDDNSADAMDCSSSGGGRGVGAVASPEPSLTALDREDNLPPASRAPGDSSAPSGPRLALTLYSVRKAYPAFVLDFHLVEVQRPLAPPHFRAI